MRLSATESVRLPVPLMPPEWFAFRGVGRSAPSSSSGEMELPAWTNKEYWTTSSAFILFLQTQTTARFFKSLRE